MNKAQELRFYIEALCVYDLKKDEVIASLLDLLQNINSERVLEKQSEFFRKVTGHKSFAGYVSKLILTDDNAFTKAAASGIFQKNPIFAAALQYYNFLKRLSIQIHKSVIYPPHTIISVNQSIYKILS